MIFVLQGLVETINQMTPAILKVVVVYLFSDHDIQLATTEQSRKLARDATVSGSGHPNGLNRNRFSQGIVCQIGLVPPAPSCNSGCSDHVQILKLSQRIGRS